MWQASETFGQAKRSDGREACETEGGEVSEERLPTGIPGMEAVVVEKEEGVPEGRRGKDVAVKVLVYAFVLALFAGLIAMFVNLASCVFSSMSSFPDIEITYGRPYAVYQPKERALIVIRSMDTPSDLGLWDADDSKFVIVAKRQKWVEDISGRSWYGFVYAIDDEVRTLRYSTDWTGSEWRTVADEVRVIRSFQGQPVKGAKAVSILKCITSEDGTEPFQSVDLRGLPEYGVGFEPIALNGE